MHYLDAKKTAGEEARRQLHRNVASNIEQVLAATPHTAPTIRLPAFHHVISEFKFTLFRQRKICIAWHFFIEKNYFFQAKTFVLRQYKMTLTRAQSCSFEQRSVIKLVNIYEECVMWIKKYDLIKSMFKNASVSAGSVEYVDCVSEEG